MRYSGEIFNTASTDSIVYHSISYWGDVNFFLPKNLKKNMKFNIVS